MRQVPRLLRAAGFGLLLSVLAGVLVAARPAAGQAPSSEDCLTCHQDPGLQRSAPGPGRPAPVFVDAKLLAGSPHAPLDCVACHTTATVGHEPRLPRVDCGTCHEPAKTALAGGAHARGRPRDRAPAPSCTGCHGTHAVKPAAALGLDTCATCHRAQVTVYRQSIHGRSSAQGSQAATCRSCHGETHALLPAKEPRAPTYHLNLPRTCAQCHADPEIVERYRIPVGDVYTLYLDSIHGRALSRSGLLVAANCSDCHGSHDIRPRTEPDSRVFRATIPKTCGACHAGVLATYAESVHGRAVATGNQAAPVCTTCHSAHQIRRVEAPAWQLEVIRECGTCHEESLRTYRDTFHGKVTALGLSRAAKCADCHGAHTVQPASDPRSSVSPAKLVATCGQCHPGATPSFTEFQPHADPTDKVRFPRLYYPYRFMTGLLVAVFGFFGLHTLLWFPRSLRERLRRRPPAGEERTES
jgi:DnaJ-class molecular chaperone